MEKLLSANDLPSAVAKQHRVMFADSSPHGMEVVTDTLKKGLASILAKQLGFPVKVTHVRSYPNAEVQAAYPLIMGIVCAETREDIDDTLSAD